eukprot:3444466-Rhodomonas_salina.1
MCTVHGTTGDTCLIHATSFAVSVGSTRLSEMRYRLWVEAAFGAETKERNARQRKKESAEQGAEGEREVEQMDRELLETREGRWPRQWKSERAHASRQRESRTERSRFALSSASVPCSWTNPRSVRAQVPEHAQVHRRLTTASFLARRGTPSHLAPDWETGVGFGMLEGRIKERRRREWLRLDDAVRKLQTQCEYHGTVLLPPFHCSSAAASQDGKREKVIPDQDRGEPIVVWTFIHRNQHHSIKLRTADL